MFIYDWYDFLIEDFYSKQILELLESGSSKQNTCTLTKLKWAISSGRIPDSGQQRVWNQRFHSSCNRILSTITLNLFQLLPWFCILVLQICLAIETGRIKSCFLGTSPSFAQSAMADKVLVYTTRLGKVGYIFPMRYLQILLF